MTSLIVASLPRFTICGTAASPDRRTIPFRCGSGDGTDRPEGRRRLAEGDRRRPEPDLQPPARLRELRCVFFVLVRLVLPADADVDAGREGRVALADGAGVDDADVGEHVPGRAVGRRLDVDV